MTIDERLEALTMNLELQAREGEAQRQRIDALVGRIDTLVGLVATDAENIRSLARIAEIHQSRLGHIEGV